MADDVAPESFANNFVEFSAGGDFSCGLFQQGARGGAGSVGASNAGENR